MAWHCTLLAECRQLQPAQRLISPSSSVVVNSVVTAVEGRYDLTKSFFVEYGLGRIVQSGYDQYHVPLTAMSRPAFDYSPSRYHILKLKLSTHPSSVRDTPAKVSFQL